MAQPVLAECGRVDDQTLRRSPTQMRWTREMAITPVRREPALDDAGRPPPSRLWPLPTHVDHQHHCRMDPDHPRWLRSCILHRNCDRWDVIVCMPVSNTSIRRPVRFMEESSARNHLRYRVLQTGVFVDPSDVGPERPVAPPPSISRRCCLSP